MILQSKSAHFLVPLHEKTVVRLLTLRAADDEPIENVVARLAKLNQRSATTSTPKHSQQEHPLLHSCIGKMHAVEVLGERIEAASLGSLFASVVDLVQYLDPDVAERLSRMRARRRHYISREKSQVHPGRPDLKTIETRSGWWVSGNVGLDDVQRGLKALCLAASLEFGVDIRFLNT